MGFENKVAFITGGTSGIGLAVAKRLVSEGTKTVIVGRDPKKGAIALEELKQFHSEVQFISADVTQAREVEAAVNETVACYGTIDLAFNNAVNTEVKGASSHEFSEEDFDKLTAITLKSVWLCMKYELREMIKTNSGAIVNTSSVDALLCSAGTAVYAAGKSGVIALTKSMAQEYGREGIRINAICPGAIRTPLLERKFTGLTPEQAAVAEQKYRELNALERIGTPDEAAAAVAWLFSEQSSYITGQNLIVDGGVSFVG